MNLLWRLKMPSYVILFWMRSDPAFLSAFSILPCLSISFMAKKRFQDGYINGTFILYATAPTYRTV